MIKIAAAVPGPGDATSLYRACGPFAQLRKMMNLDIVYPDGFFWVTVKSADIVFLQRPCSAEHLKIAQMAKNCNVPLWVDIDDDLFNVPMENPCWESYRDPGLKNVIAQSLTLADVVTVASEHLKLKFLEFNKNVYVIPNAFDDVNLKNYDPLSKQINNKIIYWRGSSSHMKDLMSVTDDIVSIAEAHPDLTWRFAGYFPWFIAERLPTSNIQHVRQLDPFEYFQFLKASDHGIAIVPLVDNELNRAKSNIAWQENTLAGAKVLGPYFPEWQIDGIMNYGVNLKFKEALTNLIEYPDLHSERATLSLNHIKDYLLLSKVNLLRKDIIYSLLK